MKTVSELFRAHLHFSTGDFDTWKHLFPHDAVLECRCGATDGIEATYMASRR